MYPENTSPCSSGNFSFIISPNTVAQIHKRPRHTALITDDSMILGIHKRTILINHPVKVYPSPKASVDDMHQYLKALKQKSPDTVILHVGANDCV